MKRFLIIFLMLTITLLNSCVIDDKEIGDSTDDTLPPILPTEEEELPTPNEMVNLTYNEKLKTFVEKDYVSDNEFYNYITTSEEYNENEDLSLNAIYVSPNGTGSGYGVDDPCSIYEAVSKVNPGETIYLRGGNYDLEGTVYLTQSGTKSNYITIRNYPNEHVYISSSKENISKYHRNHEYALIALSKGLSYVKIEGLEIANVSEKNVLGIVAWEGGQNHIIIRNNKIHDLKTNTNNIYNEDAGANAILLLGEIEESINNFLIYGNECYNNETGWCETISVSSNCENIYVIENHVHDNSNIGIDFYGNAGYCDNKALDQPRNCIAALNRVESSVCEYADAAGLYVDGAKDILLTNNYIKNSQYGIEIGAEELSEGHPVKNIIVRNNVLYKNTTCGLRIGGYDAKECGYVTDTKIYNNTIINSSSSVGGVVTISKVDGIEFRNNLVYSSISVNLVMTDMSMTYLKNITFNSNYFGVEGKTPEELKFKVFGKTQNGLSSFNYIIDGNNISGEIEFDRFYRVIAGVTIDAGDSSVASGIYDYEFKKRTNGNTIDIGAYEY